MNRFKKKGHDKGTCRINKVYLSFYNDKKYTSRQIPMAITLL